MLDLMLLGDGVSTFCADTHKLLEIVGWVVTIIKIGVPLIIIVLGGIDLAKAAISSKPEEIKKSFTSIVWRLVGGIIIFFIPTLIMLIFGFVGNFGEAQKQIDWNICYKCITAPWNSACKNVSGNYD